MLNNPMLKDVFDKGKTKVNRGNPAAKTAAMQRRLANKPMSKGPNENASLVAKAAVAKPHKETPMDDKAGPDNDKDDDLISKMKALKGIK